MGEQGTGKPLFARIIAKGLEKLYTKQITIKDLELSKEIANDEDNTIYLVDTLDPKSVPVIDISFFDLIMLLPNDFEDTMNSANKFSKQLFKSIDDEMHKLIISK